MIFMTNALPNMLYTGEEYGSYVVKIAESFLYKLTQIQTLAAYQIVNTVCFGICRDLWCHLQGHSGVKTLMLPREDVSSQTELNCSQKIALSRRRSS